MEIKEEKKILNDRLKRTIYILIILVLVALFVNQMSSYAYKYELLKNPCDVCQTKNPIVATCIYDCLEAPVQLTKDNFGNLKDSAGSCYDMSGNKKECISPFDIYLNSSLP